MWRRSRRKGVARQARDLTDECEALLRGGLVEYLRSQGQWAPAWAWVNALAHGTVDDLVRWAEGESVDDRDMAALSQAASWRAVLSFLAGDILGRVGTGGTTLEDLQRSALIPLELELMRGIERPTPDQARLAGLVMAAVRRPQ